MTNEGLLLSSRPPQAPKHPRALSLSLSRLCTRLGAFITSVRRCCFHLCLFVCLLVARVYIYIHIYIYCIYTYMGSTRARQTAGENTIKAKRLASAYSRSGYSASPLDNLSKYVKREVNTRINCVFIFYKLMVNISS